MKVVVGGQDIDLGVTEGSPVIAITDYSRRVTDDFGVTTVVRRGFSRRMSVRLLVPSDEVDALQRQLADLRATPALWVAGEDLDSLSVEGFYKDFSVDLAVPPVSFCTLSIEGLVEADAGADVAGDPAPDGQASTMRLLTPQAVTDAVLTGSNVAEDDHPQWSSLTTYAAGDRVLRTVSHRVFESAAAGNIGNDPLGTSGQWIDIGPVNRWAMFDQALGTLTTRNGSISVSLDPVAPINAIALLDVTAASIRVQAPGYDVTKLLTDGATGATFADIPSTSETVLITVTGTGAVSIGTLLIGTLRGLGITEASPSVGIIDFSKKDVDDFGDVTLVERAWAKRMSVKALIATDAVDVVMQRLAAVRGFPALWIGDDAFESLTLYGFYKDASITLDQAVSTLTLNVEGFSKAAALSPLKASDVAFEDGKTVEQLKPAEPGATEGMTPAEREEVDQLAGSLGDVDALVTAAQAQIAAIEGSVTGLQGQAADIIASIGDVDTRVDQVETGISTLNGSVTTLSQTVTNLNGTVSTLSQTVTTQGGQISTVAQSVTTLSGSMSTLSSTVSAQGVTISQNATAISTLQGQQSILSTTVSTQGAAITTLQTTTSTLQGDTATLRTQVTAGSPNLLRNGGFELGTMNYWSWAAGVAFGVNASTGTWGVFAFNNTNFADNSVAFIYSDLVGIERDYHTLTADMGYFLSGGTGSVYLQMDFYSAAGGYISSAYGPAVANGNNFSADGSTRRATKLTAYPPEGATQVRVLVVWYKASGVVQSMHVRQVKLERGQVATPYSAEASARQSFEALSTLTSQYASLSSTVSTLNSSVSVQQTAITNLQGRTAAWWSVEAVAGGRAQLRVWADANSGGGVDIVGDLRVTGNALIGGTVNPEALALDRFVKRIYGTGAGSPAAGETLLLYAQDIGVTTANGSYQIELVGEMTTTVGRQTSTLGGLPYYINHNADGGLRIVINKNGSTIYQTDIHASEYITANDVGPKAYSLNRNIVVDSPGGGDASGGNATILIYAVRGSADSGDVNQGDYYTRDVSATYSGFNIAAKTKWTFV